MIIYSYLSTEVQSVQFLIKKKRRINVPIENCRFRSENYIFLLWHDGGILN